MIRRPTKRAAIVSGIGLLLVVVGSTAQAGWVFVLAAAVLASVAASAITPHWLGAYEVTRRVPSIVQVGEEARVCLRLHNARRASLPLTRIEDRFGGLTPGVWVGERLGARATASAETTRRVARRGTYTSGPVVLTCAWPFGLLRSTRVVDVVSPCVVVPRWVPLRSFPLLEPSSYPAEQLHARARIGAGLDYMGVREFRPGDPPRTIHWRSTARRARLVVREYEADGMIRVALVLAGADDGNPPDSSFESLVSAAASVALYALVTGHPIDMVRTGPTGGVERLVDPDQEDVLGWLAGAEARNVDLNPLVGAALRRVGRRGTVVILAPTAGRAGASLRDAVRQVQISGARPVVVPARSWTWSEGPSTGESTERALLEALGHRVQVRMLSRGEDLQGCLEG